MDYTYFQINSPLFCIIYKFMMFNNQIMERIFLIEYYI
jgi:hypothetical protein